MPWLRLWRNSVWRATSNGQNVDSIAFGQFERHTSSFTAGRVNWLRIWMINTGIQRRKVIHDLSLVTVGCWLKYIPNWIWAKFALNHTRSLTQWPGSVWYRSIVCFVIDIVNSHLNNISWYWVCASLIPWVSHLRQTSKFLFAMKTIHYNKPFRWDKKVLIRDF